MTDSENFSEKPYASIPPAVTPEGRESQMISLAVNLAEKQLRKGTASAQVITHYLKLATEREKQEVEKLKRANRLLEIRAETYETNKHIEELYRDAMESMREYKGLE